MGTEPIRVKAVWGGVAPPPDRPAREAPPPPPHSLASKVSRLSKAMARWIAAGRPRVTDEQRAERLAICGGCEHRDARADACKLCGCRLEHGVAMLPSKTEMATEDCPRGKWPKVGSEPMASGLPVQMVVPGQKRPGVWNGGVIQIMVTRACDLACHSCTAGSQLISRPAVMTPDQFEAAVRSLGFGVPGQEPYWGIVGVFGGNPCSSRYFEDYCRILRGLVPFNQRGVWTNNLLGKGALCRITFNPKTSNVNTHQNADAYAEFEREWPEAIAARKEHVLRGLNDDSLHGSPYISMKDLETLPFPDGTDRENTEENRWKLIGGCTINKGWSAMVCLVGGELRAFACEIQGHMAALHADNPDWAGTGKPMPDLGLPVEPGWWRRPAADFDAQFREMCHHCAVPLNRPGQLANGGECEEFSETHRHIARPKRRERPVQFINSESLGRRDRPAIEYLSGAAPRTQ